MADEDELEPTPEVETYDISKLSGIEKTAILLLSLTQDGTASILKELEPREVQGVSLEMTNLKDVTQEKAMAVYRLFLEQIQMYSSIGLNSQDFLQKALVAALGSDKAGNILDQIAQGKGARGMDTLRWMDPRQVATIIMNEHPQIQTIVLSYLDANQAAQVFSLIPENVQLDLMMRIAYLEEVHPSALAELNEIMEKQFAGQSSAQATKLGGLQTAASIMNFLDSATETRLEEWLKEVDPDVATQIQELMFVFDDLIDVPDLSLQIVLRSADNEVLKVALKGADESLREKLLKNLSSRAAELMRDDLDTMGPVKLSEVESAQKEIVSLARDMADKDEITLGKQGNEEYV
jgi:flagellar motor switch protein FliG